jgi:hypothetical protein
MVAPAIRIVAEKGRFEHASPELTQYEQRMRVLEITVQLLITRVSMGDYWSDGIEDVRNLLQALPIPTYAFTRTIRNLQNAVFYCRQKEFGAATFELRSLRGHLHRL